MKRKIALLMVTCMAAFFLAGCGGGKPDANTGGSTADDPAVEEEDAAEQPVSGEGEWTGDVSHIIMTYLTQGSTPADLLKVQDAVNEITVPKIGVEVEFKAVSAYDAFTQFPLWLGTGEQIDLMLPLLQDLNTYVDQGLLMPLDDLVAEQAPYIKKLAEEGFQVLSSNVIAGETYAVANVPKIYGMGGSYLIDHKYVEAAGFDYDPEKIYTLDDLTELFAKVKEAYPNMYPCGIITSNSSASSSQFVYFNGVFDHLGSSAASGVLMGTDSTEVVNLYETDEYYDFLKHLNEWYKAGYIYPDAATTDSNATALVTSGVLNGYFMASAPVQKMAANDIFGTEDVDVLELSITYYGSQAPGGWTIPITSKEPEAAMRVMDLMLKDSKLSNLIQWGIEGEHYEMLDEENLLIGFPEGIDGNTSGFYNTFELYGDNRDIYIWDLGNRRELNDAYTEKAMKNPTQGVGFVYSPSKESTRIAAVSAVLNQYLPALESGSVDLDTYYTEFISALKSAGIDEVIADKQEQFDAWRGVAQ